MESCTATNPIKKMSAHSPQAPLKCTYEPSTAFVMAFIGGFSDVIGFIGVSKLFTAHITGNLVIAISEIIDHESGVASKIIAIPFFIFIAGIVTWFVEKHKPTKQILAIWVLIEALFFIGFLIAGLYVLSSYPVGSWQYISSAMLPVCAMAIHNTLLRTFMTSLPPCTMMTGNLTQLVIDFVGYYWKKKLPYYVGTAVMNHAGIKRLTNVLLAFLIGGTLAAFGFHAIGFWIVIPIIILLIAMAARSLKSTDTECNSRIEF